MTDMTTTYTKREIATLCVGVEYIDADDFPNIVTGFTFQDTPGTVTVLTDLYPAGRTFRTTDLVYVAAGAPR